MKTLLIAGVIAFLVYPAFLGKAVNVATDSLSTVVQGHPFQQASHWLVTPPTSAKTAKAAGAVKPHAVLAKKAALGPRFASFNATVDSVSSGDVIRLSDGRLVKLAQVEAPVAGCYSSRSLVALKGLVLSGDHVRVAQDPALAQQDAQGRLVAYVWDGPIFVNARLLVVGSASVRFEDEARGYYADRFEHYARQARRSALGLWGSCQAQYDPYRPLATSPR